MAQFKTIKNKMILTSMNLTGLDRIFQQLDPSLGMILTMHHVSAQKTPKFAPNAHLTITPSFLDQVIRLLKRRNIEIITIDEAQQKIATQSQTERFAVLTFDDGYRDTLENAAPILTKHQVPYTVYIAPGLIDGSADLWWEGIEALVRQQEGIRLSYDNKVIELDCSTIAKKYKSYEFLMRYLTIKTPELELRRIARELCWLYKIDMSKMLGEQIMTWDELRIMERDPLSTIGAHTINHLSVARLEEKLALGEMVQAASIIEAELGKKPNHMAYPFGYRLAANQRDFRLAKEAGFATAVTTRPGMLYPEHSQHMTALPRISVNGLYQRMRHFAPLTSGLPTRLSTNLHRLDVL